MDKYTKTAGLNYLSENSYKGDGSPGMVMGIASDARGDTNTNEAQKPTTSSKHSSERDLKKYDPAHGHTKPEGGKPGVCSCITSSGPSTDCAKCDGTGEIITPKRKDPKVDEALDAIKKLSGLEENISGNKPDTIDSEMDAYFGSKPGELEEGTNGAVVIDAQQSSKEEFDAVYKGAYDYDKILADYPLDEADGSGSYGGQSPLTYQHDDELNEIAKLSGLGEERKRRPDADDYDDFDDEDEKAEDPDKDRVPHILMQVKKALDVDGDHEIQFENGDKHKFSVINLNLFLTEYMNMKPEMREKMQQAAIVGQEEFETIIELLSPKQK